MEKLSRKELLRKIKSLNDQNFGLMQKLIELQGYLDEARGELHKQKQVA